MMGEGKQRKEETMKKKYGQDFVAGEFMETIFLMKIFFLKVFLKKSSIKNVFDSDYRKCY